MEGNGSTEPFEWEQDYDLTSVSGAELRRQLENFSREERDISYRRRVLQGKIDLIRSELVRRGGFSISPEELARALLGDSLAKQSYPYDIAASDPLYEDPKDSVKDSAQETGEEEGKSSGESNDGAGG